jgi:hypothetical protein
MYVTAAAANEREVRFKVDNLSLSLARSLARSLRVTAHLWQWAVKEERRKKPAVAYTHLA